MAEYTLENGGANEGSGEPRDGDPPGERLASVVDHLREVRERDEARRERADEGVILDQLDVVEDRLLAFGRALGADVDDVGDLPFTEEAGRDSIPEPLYVRNDRELLNQVSSWLLQGQHVGLVSPYGTGKTTLREIVRRDLGNRDDFVVSMLENPQKTTPRALYETVLEGARDVGYEIDPSGYWQVKNGIPWSTDETKQALREVAEMARNDGSKLLLLVDEIEDVPEKLLTAMQVAGDTGVRLFVAGTPAGKQRLEDIRATLDSRLRYYDGIDPFAPEDVAEYMARSLAYFRDNTYDGEGPDMFTPGAILDVHERTDGNPRDVRLECRELFTRAAFVWFRSGQDAERIRITPELREQRFGMDR